MKNAKAIRFLGERTRGRTRPVDLECETSEGDQIEAIVKLRSNLLEKETSLALELIANLLAKRLDLPVPEAVIVDIENDFVDVCKGQTVFKALSGSIGKNFGTVNLTPGYTTWPKDMSIPKELFSRACQILAFDALIQNTDRRDEKPNLLWKENRDLFLIDHELAFSFRLSVGQVKEGWLRRAFSSAIKNHIFRNQFRGRELDFGGMPELLATVSRRDLVEIRSSLPNEWIGSAVDQILEHIESIAQKSGTFFAELRAEAL